MRAMSVALSNKDLDDKIQVWSLGPHKINNFTAAFCNSSENFLKHKGYKIYFSKVNTAWVEQNSSYINYYAYFSLPKEHTSKTLEKMQKVKGCEIGIFRY